MVHAIPVVALLAGHPEMLQAVQTTIKVTQNAEKAVAFGSAAARIMEKVRNLDDDLL